MPRVRNELKYYISNGEYLVLRDRLKEAMMLDENAEKQMRTYHIRSLYFDDIHNTAMWEKAEGVEFRKKWRIRIYNYSDKNITLEKKSKFDRFTAKESEKLTRLNVEGMIYRNDYSFLFPSGNKLFEEMYADVRTKLLRPVVIVDYIREPYVYPAGNVRITFDKDLHSGNFRKDIFTPEMMPVPILDDGWLILEVKYDYHLPGHIRAILNSTNGLRSAISKYALCRRFH